MKKIMISAGEASGDFYGAELAKEFVKKYKEEAVIAGFGGRLMKDAGVDVRIELPRYAVVGFAQALVKLPGLISVFQKAKNSIRSFKPDILVVIDYPGFHLKLIKNAKKAGVKKIVYYITPQVWAWKYGRINTIKKYADLAIPVLPFEKSIFEKEGINCAYFGHPMASFIKKESEKNSDMEKKKGLIGLFPGSRRSEVESFLPVMLSAAEKIKEKRPESSFAIFRTQEVEEEVFGKIIARGNIGNIEVIKGPAYRERLALEAAVAKSGTTTLELALAGVPQTIVYKVSGASYALMKMFAKISGLKYIGLPNLILDRPLVNELIQHDFTPQKTADSVLGIIENEDAAKTLKEGYKILEKMLYYDDEINGRIADRIIEEQKA
ncbi:MAG: lipid-A-disaccharide synthase [Candidatus Goldiibacteriota bacterium]